jgi:hypothetical protein
MPTPPRSQFRSARGPGRIRATWYVAGAIALPVVAWVVGALSAAEGDSDGRVLSGFLAALWTFATFVVVVNVVELALLLRRRRGSERPS